MTRAKSGLNRLGLLVIIFGVIGAAASAQAQGLGAFLAGDGSDGMSMKARLAVEHGRHGLQASVDWARWARRQFDEAGRGGSG